MSTFADLALEHFGLRSQIINPHREYAVRDCLACEILLYLELERVNPIHDLRKIALKSAFLEIKTPQKKLT